MIPQAHMLPRGIQAQGARRRPMQGWVSCSGGRTTACDPHALGGNSVFMVVLYVWESATGGYLAP